MQKNVAPVRPDYDVANYDETKIAPYTLEDPLTFANGQKLQSPAEWPARRREILDIFAAEMYGVEPPKPDTVIIEKFESQPDALAGFAVREQFKMYFKADKSGPCINWLLYRPRYAKKPCPVIEFLNYYGNHELTMDPEVFRTASWVHDGDRAAHNQGLESNRGFMCNPNNNTVMPIGMIIAQGYALLTASYADISPDPDPDGPEFDQDHFAYTGVFDLWGKRDETRTDNTTSLGAWAWGLSRGIDLAEQHPDLDAKKVVVTGCSRLGKSAFLAAARDERFAVCVPNQCGGGGVTLAKRDFGENIGTEMKMFKHWYCKAYKKYETNPAQLLTFDQHLLVAAIAPRPLLVQGFGSPWFDPKGEFLSCQAASCVWEFLGKPGLPQVEFPDEFDTKAIGPVLGYVRRSEKHGLSAYDWTWLLDFANANLKN